MPVRTGMASAGGLVDLAVSRRPQLEGLQVRVSQEVFYSGRYFVREVYDGASPGRIKEFQAADDGGAGAHMAATYSAREYQNISFIVFPYHGVSITKIQEAGYGVSLFETPDETGMIPVI